MFKIVAVGEEEQIMGFRGIGADLINVDSPEVIGDILKKLSQDTSISLIMITETMAKDCMAKIAGLREKSPAIVLLIPPHTGTHNLSLQEIRLEIEKAAGIDLLN